MTKRSQVVSVAVAAGVAINLVLIGTVFADTKAVDPSGGGDYTNIQAAVNDLPNPGPRTIIVRAGIYHEAVRFSARNTQATNDSQRIIIMADTNTAPGSVIVTPPSGSSGVYLGHSRFITLQGLAITGVGGKGVPAVNLDGGAQGNEDIATLGCQIHDNASYGILVRSGNPRTWIMNNLIHDNGSNKKGDDGVMIADGTNAPVYLVNNTIVLNKADGVFVGVPRLLYLVNNLIVSNGKYGFELASGSSGSWTGTLLNNMFYANMRGDIASPGSFSGLDVTASGNRTTTGKEIIGVAGCTFPNCRSTTLLTALFVRPGTMAADFHLAADSPAIDRGVSTFTDGTTTWAIVEDLDGNPRPQDGDGDCFAIVDMGCYEAPTVSCQAEIVPPLARLMLGDGGGLISNVNANTLGGIPYSGYATTIGSYPNMSVGTATFAATAGNALNLGYIPPGGYVQTNDTRVVRAITSLYATGSGSVTVSGNAGTINFGSGGGGAGGVTNLWLLNGGPVLTSDELEVVTAGGLTGALSNYGGRVQLTLSNTGSAFAQALSNVLAVGNVSGTGIVMSAKDATSSHGFFFVDSSGLTNRVFGSGSNVVHIAPSGATGTVWDAINLPYPASTNGNYQGMNVGTATFASSAANATATNVVATATALGPGTGSNDLVLAASALQPGGTYSSTTVGTATFAGTATAWTGSNTLAQYAFAQAQSANATNSTKLNGITSSGYVQTNNPIIINGLTNLYSSGSGSVTVSGNAGTINFGAVALSNVLAAGNISGTGIVMSANGGTNSYGLFLANSSGLTNQFLGSGSNLVHVAPSGATGTVWDAINLPYPAQTNGTYLGMNVGTATIAGNATTAGTAIFATSAGAATNWTDSSSFSNTLAAVILAITNGLPTGAVTNGLSTADYSIYDNTTGTGYITNSPALDPADFCVHFKFKGTALGSDAVPYHYSIIQKAIAGSAGYNGWRLKTFPGGPIQFLCYTNGSGNATACSITSTVVAVDATWHDVEASYNHTANYMRLFIDGVQQGSGVHPGLGLVFTNTQNFQVNGTSPTAPVNMFLDQLTFSGAEKHTSSYTPTAQIPTDSDTIFQFNFNTLPTNNPPTSFASDYGSYTLHLSGPWSMAWGSALPNEVDTTYLLEIGGYYTTGQVDNTFLQIANEFVKPFYSSTTPTNNIGSSQTLFDSDEGGLGTDMGGGTRYVRTAIGTFAANSHNKQIQVYFESSSLSPFLIYDSGAVAENGGAWKLEIDVMYGDGFNGIFKGTVTMVTSGGLMQRIAYFDTTGAGYCEQGQDCSEIPYMTIYGTGTADNDITRQVTLSTGYAWSSVSD
jgi:hypothetical protein